MDAALQCSLTAWPTDTHGALDIAINARDPRPAAATLRLEATQPDLTSILQAAAGDIAHLIRGLEPIWAEELNAPASQDARRARRTRLGVHAAPLLRALQSGASTEQLLRAAPMEALMRFFHDILTVCFPDRPLILFLLVEDAQDVDAQEAALLWLSAHFPAPIWAIGPATSFMTRLPQAHLGAPSEKNPAPRPGFPETPTLCAPLGRPHPNSAAEQRLEAALANCDWAAGRRWNQRWSSGPAGQVYLLDLFWPHANVAVEIDGTDHLDPIKYQEDRRRDRILQRAGCAVLRFTNQDVLADAAAVVWFIESVIKTRRADGRMEKIP